MGGATGRRTAVPERLRSWLFDPRSLTRRLSRRRSQIWHLSQTGAIQVRLLSQRWSPVLPMEREILGLRVRERALVREVLLTCHGTPWVFARSVFPSGCLRGPQRRLARLGEQPLGRLLFGSSRMRRVQVQVGPATNDPRMLQRCAAALHGTPPGAWQRSSVFAREDRALLVSEIFLEAFTHE